MIFLNKGTHEVMLELKDNYLFKKYMTKYFFGGYHLPTEESELLKLTKGNKEFIDQINIASLQENMVLAIQQPTGGGEYLTRKQITKIIRRIKNEKTALLIFFLTTKYGVRIEELRELVVKRRHIRTATLYVPGRIVQISRKDSKLLETVLNNHEKIPYFKNALNLLDEVLTKMGKTRQCLVGTAYHRELGDITWSIVRIMNDYGIWDIQELLPYYQGPGAYH